MCKHILGILYCPIFAVPDIVDMEKVYFQTYDICFKHYHRIFFFELSGNLILMLSWLYVLISGSCIVFDKNVLCFPILKIQMR